MESGAMIFKRDQFVNTEKPQNPEEEIHFSFCICVPFYSAYQTGLNLNNNKFHLSSSLNQPGDKKLFLSQISDSKVSLKACQLQWS